MKSFYWLGLGIISCILLASPRPANAQPELLGSYNAESGLDGWEGHALFLEEADAAAGINSYGLGRRVGSFEYHFWSSLSPLLGVPEYARTGGWAVHVRCQAKLNKIYDMDAWLAIYRIDAAGDPIDMGFFVPIEMQEDWFLFSVPPLLMPPEVATVRIEFNMGDPLLEKIPGIHHVMLYDEVEIYLLKIKDVPVTDSSVGAWKSNYAR